MSSVREWPKVFASYGLQFQFEKPYRGQSDTFQALVDDRLRTVDAVICPTGYGKTEVQMMQAAYLYKAGQIDHVAVFVPKDNLRGSFVNVWRRGLIAAGLDSSEFVVWNGNDDLMRAYRYKDSKFMVMIFCYQQLPNDVIAELLRSGRWLVVADEAHHLYQDGQWAKYIAELHRTYLTYYTATPYRGDRKALHGAPYIHNPINDCWELDPVVEVTAREAQNEKALARLNLTVFKYWVDVIEMDGTERRIYSDDLSDEDLRDFSNYETKTQLRYKTGYLHPMIKRMVELYYRKNDKNPDQHQIIVKAMTNLHAEHLCQEINRYVGDDDFAHWVGVMRPEETNTQLLLRFQGKKLVDGIEVDIPAYDRFACLVQVDMAGEGYNNPNISVGCKADLTKNPSTILQLIGRMLRRNYGIGDFNAETVDLLVSSDDTATIDLVRTSYEIGEDIREGTGGGNGKEPGDDPIWLPTIPSIEVIKAEFDRAYTVPDGDGYTNIIRSEVMDLVRRYEPTMLQFCDEDALCQMFLEFSASSPVGNRAQPGLETLGESGQMKYWQQRNQKYLKTVTSIVMKLLPVNGYHFNGNEKKVAGQVKKKINSKYYHLSGRRSVEKRTPEEEQEKCQWLKDLSDQMNQTRQVPSWILFSIR